MTMALDGLAKLIEECGELIQVAGKRLAYYSTDQHPDGTNLRQRLIEELGDVAAAIDFFTANQGDDFAAEVEARWSKKVEQFAAWHAAFGNNHDSVKPPAPNDQPRAGTQ